MNYSKRTVRNRYKLLQAVQNEMQARLDGSLYNAVRINLSRETPTQQIKRLWDVEVKIGKRPAFQLPPETSITQIFAQSAGKLMILGATGSGKTTTLLELALELISRAENDAEQPMPVFLSLAAWQEKYTNIADWLVAEMKSRYGIKPKLSKQWLKDKQILPLLDGLDELELSKQELCLQAINKLLEGENKPKNIVICTRMEEYKNCQTKLRLHGAIYLRPLTNNQIREYLMGCRSRELWENIKAEPQLLDLARIPLFLNMMALAYEEILIHAWRRINSRKERQDYLFNAYIRRMLTRDIQSKFYRKRKQPRPEQMRSWLTWLAKRMSEFNQQEFMIENIDFNWLQTPSQKRLYRIGVVLSLGGILIDKQAILQFILAENGYISQDYARFLGLATERSFLQKVNRRYRFVHELLQKYFSQL